ncbi:hypothetical protein [Jiulongibacter sp. NS-SX5]|uniref:hypothetical protein n=1 Tax=Jiulongibacter sp. NS-SX5 TaxID=3463854 RepID=UPI004058A04A
MKHLTVVPFGGLGNRMRVLNSAFYLSKDKGFATEVAWLEKAELNASLKEIFYDTGFSFQLTKGLKYWFIRHFVKHIYILKYSKLYRAILNFFFDEVLFDEDVREMFKNRNYTRLNGKENVFLATCFQFYSFDSFDNFIPSLEIQKRLGDLNVNKNTIGVHIRRTDHIDIIAESDLNSYHEALEKELSKNLDLSIYLATDDSEVKEEFVKKYGRKISTQKTDLSRNSSAGIIGAYTDILALSKCQKIICNTKSSFAETAIKIGLPKEVIRV